MVIRAYQILTGSIFAVLFASFFFPQLFPWSSRDFTIPTEGVVELEQDRYGVWRTETRVLLRDTTSFWKHKLAPDGIDYTEPSLSFFFGETNDACGEGIATEVALYCLDAKEIVVSTGNYQGVSRQVGQRNHFAVAYSFAHQVGHHVQNLRGMPAQHMNEDAANYAKRIELQADCYAGVWLRSAQGPYGEFDFNDVYAIAKQFVKRRLHPLPQMGPGALMETGGYTDPQERTDWARKGYKSGSLADCETAP